MATSDVARVTLDDTVVPDAHSSFAVGDLDVDLDYDGATWTHTVAFELEHTCGDATCFAETLPLMLGTDDEDELRGAVVTVTYEDGWSGEPVRAWAELVEGAYRLEYRLPRVLVDGETIAVEITYARVPTAYSSFDQVLAMKDLGMVQFSHGLAHEGNEDWMLQYLPAWPAIPSAHASFGERFTVHLEAHSAEDHLILANGAPSVDPPLTSVSYRAMPKTPPARFHVAFLDGVSPLIGSNNLPLRPMLSSPTGSATLYTYVDDGLTPAALSLFQTYVEGSSSPSLPDDLTHLTTRLEGPPTDAHHLVFLRPAEGGSHEYKGGHLPGMAFNLAFEAQGDVYVNPTEAQALSLHELTHWYYGEHLRFRDHINGANAGYWLQEGIPQLLMWEQYGEFFASHQAGGQRVLFEDWRDNAGDTTHLEVNAANENLVRYFVGPYVLSQAYWSGLANGGSDAAFWEAWRDLWMQSTYQGTQSSAADVQAALDHATGSTAFYTEWVARGTRGTPVLGLTRLDVVSTDASGEDLVEAQVEQVQVTMAGWDAFTDVPYLLGCTPTSDQASPAFTECGVVGANTRVAGRAVQTMAGAPQVLLSLHRDPSLPVGVSPLPGYVGLFRNERLLPGGLLTDAMHDGSVSWALHCGAGSTLADCQDDADQDGAPDSGDCDDADSLIYPFQGASSAHTYGLGSGVDYACDGWTW